MEPNWLKAGPESKGPDFPETGARIWGLALVHRICWHGYILSFFLACFVLQVLCVHLEEGVVLFKDPRREAQLFVRALPGLRTAVASRVEGRRPLLSFPTFRIKLRQRESERPT